MIATKPTTMICTLGGQPQVVTFALDALLADGVPITHCIVLHFANDNRRIKRSLDKLAAEFVNGRCRFNYYPAPPLNWLIATGVCRITAVWWRKIKGNSEIVPNWF